MLNGLDLFSGIGGLSVALGPWVRPIAYCESDPYAQSVLLSRMSHGQLPIAPIWDDIRTLRGSMLPSVDILYGGFPCQDISSAGARVGLGGGRSGLFNHIARLTKETNAKFVFLENVPAIRTRGLNSVAQAFTDLGHDCRWTVVSAKEVGACHLRKRWFMLTHSNGQRIRIKSGRRLGWSNRQVENVDRFDGSPRSLADGQRRSESRISRPAAYNGWDVEPCLRGANHGVFARVDRIRCLGNAVVPLQAQTAFKRLMGLGD